MLFTNSTDLFSGVRGALALVFVVLGASSLGWGQELSSTAKLLKDRVEKREYDAIRQAADSGDKTIMPYLRQLTLDETERAKPNTKAFLAHVALAKLGDSEALNQVMSEIDGASPPRQNAAMLKLSLIGGNAAFKKFFALLDDGADRPDTDCFEMFEKHNREHPEDRRLPYCTTQYWPKRVSAMNFLSKMVDDPPFKNLRTDEKAATLWKAWFATHPELLQ